MTSTNDDPFGLARFVEAQADDYPRALQELRAGRKRSHWMWYVLPQLRGLGSSSRAAYFGIGSAREAEAYLAHPVLGPRLRECTALVNAVPEKSVTDILGRPDDLKFRSSMTLFAAAAPEEPRFAQALAAFFAGAGDPETLSRI